ncbi:MAG TPA: HAMP domain-containing sensor histidine kinase, partial [Gemmataceae bacterium]
TDWKWAAGVLERQTRLILGMLDRLHDVSRLAQGKLTLHRQWLDLAALARRAAEGQRGAFAEAGVGLDMEAPEAVWVDGDPDRLAQVVRELLDNAYRFTDRGGRVVVKLVRGADGRAELSVRDTGPGVGAAFLPRIFEPFAQADDNRQRGRKGLGVGLALVRGLAELHGGSVWAESPGQGTAVTVRLPAAAEGQAS